MRKIGFSVIKTLSLPYRFEFLGRTLLFCCYLKVLLLYGKVLYFVGISAKLQGASGYGVRKRQHLNRDRELNELPSDLSHFVLTFLFFLFLAFHRHTSIVCQQH